MAKILKNALIKASFHVFLRKSVPMKNDHRRRPYC